MPLSPDKSRPHLSIANVSSPAVPVDNKPDPATLLGLQQLNDASLAVQIEKLRAELDSFEQDVAQRKQYAPRLFVLTCCWLGAVIAILLLQGFSAGTTHFFSLGNDVLIALLGTTTINVIGLLYIVAKYLFSAQTPNEPSSQK
ncbi:MAG TPA: hypothetical protein VLJ11_16335 [Bryobacteraceae bacterium]|nr:hypothetical protein [Bryobacteraceae bacterium]